MTLYSGDTFEKHGMQFKVHIEPDDDGEAPWERSDGHGPVRHMRRSEKRPGERPLIKDRDGTWLYDWQAACKLARKDGWNAEPYGAPNRIERAVQADFDFLRGWLNDDWYYVGVCVSLLDKNGEDATEKYENAIWGIESNSDDCIGEVADDLADRIREEKMEQRRIKRSFPVQKEGLKEWEGVKLPEVPDEYRWELRDDDHSQLTLRVVDDTREHPFVLWAYTNPTTICIGPLDTDLKTWEYEGEDREEGLNIATTRVLLGMWGE